MRFRRTIAWTAAVLVAMCLVVCAVTGIFAAEAALHPQRRALTAADEENARQVAAINHAQLAEVTIEATDHVTLRAWSLVPAEANGDAALLLHGQSDNRAGMLGPAAMLLHHGYAVLLPDARAHGASGGAIATYGVLEADDVRRWFEWLQHAEHPRCIDGLGDSMGAAQILESLTVEHEFCAVVAESGFSSFRAVAYDRMGQWFGVGPSVAHALLGPAVEFGFVYGRMRYGVDLGKASPLRAVAGSTTPVMLIHGLADGNIRPYHSELIRQSNPAVQLWEPPAADHCGASSAAPAEYERRVIGWFADHDVQSMRARR